MIKQKMQVFLSDDESTCIFCLVLIETQFPILSQSRRVPLLQVVSNKPLQIKEPVFFMFLFSSVLYRRSLSWIFRRFVWNGTFRILIWSLFFFW